MKTLQPKQWLWLPFALGLSSTACTNQSSTPAQESSEAQAQTHTLLPDQKKQTVLGFGVEIQSDSIGSGSQDIPDEPIGVPHDLTEAERYRLGNEMLKGFRYLRIAGGLYWRGLDEEKKYMGPRWPEQMDELKTLIDVAGIEGISFEYWSPAPYWKANQRYIAKVDHSKLNTLRPFGPNFEQDPVYKGDREAFFSDFADAVVSDIKTFEDAGIKVSKFGLQNEPDSNNDDYSTMEYFTPEDYVETFKAVATKVRKHNDDIMILSDSALTQPFLRFIKPGMQDPEVVDLVDAFAIHPIGYDSSTVKGITDYIKKEFPDKPWFQNEYEYLTGGGTPQRTLNTVQHIMNSFQIGENKSWYWLHILKPAGYAEASGYALGFWNSKIAPLQANTVGNRTRWRNGPELDSLPAKLQDLEYISSDRGNGKKPGAPFNFWINQKSRLYMLVHERGEYVPKGWQRTDMKVNWQGGSDVVYSRVYDSKDILIPAHKGKDGNYFGVPHAIFVEPLADNIELEVRIGTSRPIYVDSLQKELYKITKDLKPGHFTYFPLNWNAVGSFVKRMPWNSIVLDVKDMDGDEDGRILAFEKPDGKRTLVFSNRGKAAKHFNVGTNLPGTTWQGYRYTPFEGGKNTQGISLGVTNSGSLMRDVPPLSWEFWEEQ